MNLRFGVAVLVFFVMSAVSSGRCAAQTEPNANGQEQQPAAQEVMSVAPVPTIIESVGMPFASTDSLIRELSLEMFDAAKAGDMSVCNNNARCLKYAPRIRGWICANDICKKGGQGQRPVDCFKNEWDQKTTDTIDAMNALLCPLIKSPNPETRQALLKYLPANVEGNLVKNEAYVLALNESAEACQEHIKEYVGPYGSSWTYVWYRAMAGCRILSGERTRAQEEKDLKIWLEAIQKARKCSEIENEEMRAACEAPESTSPQPVDDD